MLNNIITIYSRIIEVDDYYVVLEYINGNKEFKVRKFHKISLNHIKLELYKPIIIKRGVDNEGNVLFEFNDGTNIIDDKIFEVDYFNNLEPEIFKNPLVEDKTFWLSDTEYELNYGFFDGEEYICSGICNNNNHKYIIGMYCADDGVLYDNNGYIITPHYILVNVPEEPKE